MEAITDPKEASATIKNEVYSKKIYDNLHSLNSEQLKMVDNFIYQLSRYGLKDNVSFCVDFKNGTGVVQAAMPGCNWYQITTEEKEIFSIMRTASLQKMTLTRQSNSRIWAMDMYTACKHYTEYYGFYVKASGRYIYNQLTWINYTVFCCVMYYLTPFFIHHSDSRHLWALFVVWMWWSYYKLNHISRTR